MLKSQIVSVMAWDHNLWSYMDKPYDVVTHVFYEYETPLSGHDELPSQCHAMKFVDGEHPLTAEQADELVAFVYSGDRHSILAVGGNTRFFLTVSLALGIADGLGLPRSAILASIPLSEPPDQETYDTVMEAFSRAAAGRVE